MHSYATLALPGVQTRTVAGVSMAVRSVNAPEMACHGLRGGAYNRHWGPVRCGVHIRPVDQRGVELPAASLPLT